MSVQTLPYNSNKQLTKHINAQELRCKCGGTENIKFNMDLLNKVEQLMTLIGADKIIISSGYRCPKHDRNVGGSGSGPHVDGHAIDCCIYKNGKPVNTKYISCIAQDMGFRGIANITAGYDYIHLDMKNRTYYGNELINYNTVTNNFYSYYGLTKEQVNSIKVSSSSTSNSNTSSSSTSTTTSSNKNALPKWNNHYDSQIKELQNILRSKGANITADGISGNNTYEACRKYTIEKNDSGSLTKWVQERLKSKGFNPGTIDGKAGNTTMTAIANFQKTNGLGQGYLGGTDWAYLIN